MSADPKPQVPITFTQMEQIEINTTIQKMQQGFGMAHQEIYASSNSDLENMMRQGKQMYVNLAFKFAAEYQAVMKKQEGK